MSLSNNLNLQYGRRGTDYIGDHIGIAVTASNRFQCILRGLVCRESQGLNHQLFTDQHPVIYDGSALKLFALMSNIRSDHWP